MASGINEDESNSTKRKCISYSAKEKLDILKLLDEGSSCTNVAQQYEIHPATIRRWKQKREEIKKLYRDQSVQAKRKGTGFNELHEALYIWFCENRRNGIPVSGTILKGKALQLNAKLGGNQNFVASEGWLSRWKDRYGIRQLTVCGEQLSANKDAADAFKKQFAEEILAEGWTRSQVFNADETGLNFRMLPNRTLADRSETNAPGYKKNKDRLTVMACSNADGTLKLPLVVIGKSAKPRCFKNLSKDLLPVYYTHQRSAWMDRTIFQTWFTEEFVPPVTKFLKDKGLPLKAVLLLDNAPSHPAAEQLTIGQITVKFFPPNVTSLIQPMDQGILENLKSRYRLLLLTSILNGQEEGTAVTSLLKSINVKDVIYWLSDAWDAIAESTTSKCWKKLWPEESPSSHEEESSPEEHASDEIFNVLRRIDGHQDISREDAQSWAVKGDNEVEPVHSDDELIAMVTTPNDGNGAENYDYAEDISVTPKEALDGLETAIKFFDQNQHLSPSEMQVLRRIKQKAMSLKLRL